MHYHKADMTEAIGCAILKECFSQAGFHIVENYPLAEGVIQFSVDGYDPSAKVGYEFVTTEAGDRQEITPSLIAELEGTMKKGELYIFLIDEQEVASAAELSDAAKHFLEKVQQLRNQEQGR